MCAHFATRDIRAPVIPPNADKPLPTMAAYEFAIHHAQKIAVNEKFLNGEYFELY